MKFVLSVLCLVLIDLQLTYIRMHLMSLNISFARLADEYPDWKTISADSRTGGASYVRIGSHDWLPIRNGLMSFY